MLIKELDKNVRMVVVGGWGRGERKARHFLNVCLQGQPDLWNQSREFFKSGNSKHSSSCPSVAADCRQLFSPSTIEEMGKKRQAFGLGVFFFNHGSFRSNLHLRGRETIFCYHSISLKFKNSWGYFSWFIKFTSFQRNLPADLSLPQQLGLQEWAVSWMPSTWVHCLGLSLWSFMLEYLFFFFFFWGWKRAGKESGYWNESFQSIFPFLEIKGKSYGCYSWRLNPS